MGSSVCYTNFAGLYAPVSIVSDLDKVAVNSICTIRKYNIDTLHTPYTEKLTSYAAGICITYQSSDKYISQTAVSSGQGAVFERAFFNGSWSRWIRVLISSDLQAGNVAKSVPANSYVDVPVVFDIPFNAVPSVVASFNGKPATIGQWCYCYVHSIGNSGFSIRITNATTATTNPSVNWIAVLK
ncbi:hypothetical protein DWX10_13435 [Clostridium sp. AF18-27]|nr:hypothetical protein DWX10_13435 [Clostridium sp. AF18-27]